MRVPGVPYVQGRNSYGDRDGRKYGIAIHNTSNDASAEGEASYATRRTDGVSSHLYADADSVVQSLDTGARAGHAGSYEGNEHAIAVEITGTNDKSRSWWLANVAWDRLGTVLAAVIRHHWPDGSFAVRRAAVDQMRADPKIRALYGHDDMRRAWGGTTHTDPGPNFPWDRLIQAILAAMGDDMGLADTPLVGGRTERQAVADLWWAAFRGNTLSVEQQALARMDAQLAGLTELVRQALTLTPGAPLTAEQLEQLTVRVEAAATAAVDGLAARLADADRARAQALAPQE